MPQPGLLPYLEVLVQRERQRRRFAEHLQRRGGDLDAARREVGILVAGRTSPDGAGDPYAVLGAQPVRNLGHLALAEQDLRDP